jgi:histidyl-tRNA synthetase
VIENVRGMRDVLPETWRAQQAIQQQLAELHASYGYAALDLPVLEQRELYLTKLGEELVGKVYEFQFNGRDIALRPEWTASVLRAYVAQLQDQPLPLRLGYCGPVFRYERPQRGTYRQFTQQGVELLGSVSPRGDAEAIGLACAGLELLGLREYRLVLGHIGLIRSFLSQLGLDERTQGLLAWSLERMRSQGLDAVRAQLAEAQGEQIGDATLLEGMSDEQASALLLRVLQALDVGVQFGTRPPAEIVGRLLRKLRRADPAPRVERALEFMARVIQLRGAPEPTLAQASALLDEYQLDSGPLDELRAIGALLASYGVPEGKLTLDFGLGRGLHYYTGTIFEIYDAEGLQLCGGGRYDDLVQALGAKQSVPAVGFAYGLERVASALEREGALRPTARPPQVLVAATEDAAYPYALGVAARLRRQGFAVITDLRARSAASNLRDALRRGVGFLALVGPADVADQMVLWRDLASREERRIALEEIRARL